MSALESIVLPLAESRALAEKVKLDTALVWVIPIGVMGLPIPYVSVTGDSINHHFKCVPAPVFSELMNAIYARYDNAEITMYGSGLIDVWIGKEAHQQNEDTDLLAAYALLMEVAK